MGCDDEDDEVDDDDDDDDDYDYDNVVDETMIKVCFATTSCDENDWHAIRCQWHHTVHST